jgi:response regulator RpfG family c-di-GMP phosphodiesterase
MELVSKTKTKFETVMVIDDVLIDLFIASRNLNRNNFTKKIIECTTGEKALNYLKENQENIQLLPEVIFLDVSMRGMSGFEFLEEYEKFSPDLKNHCQLYMLSSTCDPIEINRARSNSNVIDILEKPLSRNYLENIKKKKSRMYVGHSAVSKVAV